MTSAHRPTWKAASGGSNQGGNAIYIPTRQYSSRDMPSHLTLKTRVPGQGTQDEAKQIDFRAELLAREQQKLKEKGGLIPQEISEKQEENEEIQSEQEIEDEFSLEKLMEKLEKEGRKRENPEGEPNPFPQDEDANLSEADLEFEGKPEDLPENEEEKNEEEDEDAELMREFEKVKKEKEEEMKKKEAERLEEQKMKQREDILKGNPIYNSTSYSLKKRWTEDTVFKNQARNLPKDKSNRFVNDIIRSDFHRKFLAKYIQ